MHQAKTTERGFAHIGLLIAVVAIVLVSGIAIFRIQTTKKDKDAHLVKTQDSNIIKGQLTSEDREKTTLATANSQTTTQSAPQTPSSTSQSATTQKSPSTTPKSSTTSKTPSQTAPSSTTSTATPPTTTPPSTPTSTYQRPTSEFCASKNGASFTNAWVTDNNSNTYQIWQNGGWASVTETGTAAYNFDTMKVVGVIPFKAQAKWAICTYERPGYVTFYYQPSGSVYTYNWLVPFGSLTLTQP